VRRSNVPHLPDLVGQFKNGGRQWRPAGTPAEVDVHDFPDKELGKAIPYGIYDVAANTGWVNVGCDHDTAAFAVESIRRCSCAERNLLRPGRGQHTRSDDSVSRPAVCSGTR
jgi:hypothetical protein